MKKNICLTCENKIGIIKKNLENKSLHGNTITPISTTSINNITRAIIWGYYKWDFAHIKSLTGGNIYYSINGSLKIYENIYSTKLYNEVTVGDDTYNMIKEIMDNLSEIIPFTFVYTSNFDSSIIDFNIADSSFFSPNIIGYAYPPGTILSWDYGDTKTSWEYDGCIFINVDYFDVGYNKTGSWLYNIFLHELGHALGLSHPHDGGGQSTVFEGVTNPWVLGTYKQNDFVNTLMTYIYTDSDYGTGLYDDHGYADNFMSIDIAALQYLYGKTIFNSGNTTYYLTPNSNNNWKTIHDSGGYDTINAINSNKGVIIDIRPANLNKKSVLAGGGKNRAVNTKGGQGGLIIGYKTKIERVIGSNFSDKIRGTTSSKIYGRGGNDKIYIYNRASAYGNSGNDTFYINGTKDMRIYGGSGKNTISFNKKYKKYKIIYITKEGNIVVKNIIKVRRKRKWKKKKDFSRYF